MQTNLGLEIQKNAAIAANYIQELSSIAAPTVGLILGSGWADVTAHIQNAQKISYADIPAFPQPTVQGHVPELWLGNIGPTRVAVLAGRKHSYETGHAQGMFIPIATLKALGCSILVQTNAGGSVNSKIPVGSLMAISDHLNLAQISPLVGLEGSDRFVPLGNAYDAQLRQEALAVAAQSNTPMAQGVYAWFMGPHFETPAEIRMCQTLGADAVGMSTVPETIIARYLQMRVLAFSLITNMGAGLSDEAISHAHTLAQAQAASAMASNYLATLLGQIKA
ncbi:unnamed protein product [Darwinula stevensoni]|uniref:Purine nucleoside phosphorylase n=1 Tax=Darwinula stevensoni TaxID=69355 RepID=A0A7R9AGS0_9CRUS|nr:unnamed protein product [Darwinula stevensoni]CAG0904600.1 unnamed protein product [Darwinula stevensoni]